MGSPRPHTPPDNDDAKLDRFERPLFRDTRVSGAHVSSVGHAPIERLSREERLAPKPSVTELGRGSLGVVEQQVVKECRVSGVKFDGHVSAASLGSHAAPTCNDTSKVRNPTSLLAARG